MLNGVPQDYEGPLSSMPPKLDELQNGKNLLLLRATQLAQKFIAFDENQMTFDLRLLGLHSHVITTREQDSHRHMLRCYAQPAGGIIYAVADA